MDKQTATRDEIVLNILSHIRELDRDEAWQLLEKISELLDAKDETREHSTSR